MGIWNKLFGASAEKHEEKGDELRLDLMYRDAAFYYRKALEALEDPEGTDAERLNNKLFEVRRKIVTEFMEEAEELASERDYRAARDKLQSALDLTDDPILEAQLEAELARIAGLVLESNPRVESETDIPEEIASTEEDLFELAIAGFDPADQEAARSLGPEFRRAYEACQNEDWPAAVECFERVLEEHPDQPLVLEMTAMAYVGCEKPDPALTLYRRAHKAGPDRPGTVQGLIDSLRHLDRIEEADRVLGEAVAARPAAADLSDPWIALHLDHARRLSETDHHDEAVAVLTALIQVVPGNRGFLFFNLAGLLEAGGNDEECRRALESAMEASPRSSLYRERLADFLVHRGRELDQALKLLVEANQVETTGAAGMFGGGVGKVKISPNKARYLYKMARIYYLKGEDREAERTITAARHATSDPEILNAIEELHRDLGETSSPG